MNIYKRRRLPPDIISYSFWLYYRFNLSQRRNAGPFIEDLPVERGITFSREAIRLWCIKFGDIYACSLRRKHRGYGDTSSSIKFSPVCRTIQINGKRYHIWRAVDQDGEVIDVYLQSRWDGAAAKRFFKRLIRGHEAEPRTIVTDKLRSYPFAHREVMPEVVHVTDRYANNRAEQSHEATQVRERGMGGPVSRRFKSTGLARRFIGAFAAVNNLFNLDRHVVKSEHYRTLRFSAFACWNMAVS